MKSLIACLLALILVACSLGRPTVERQSFLIQPEFKGARAAMPMGESLRIGRVEVARPFDGKAFIYRRDEVRYETDFYNEFAADPADMVADAAAGWFKHSGLFRQVLAPRAGSFAEYRLDASVSALYVDFRTDAPAAVLVMRWRLVRDSDMALVLDLDSEERVSLPERTPRGAALAHGAALERALARLATALKATKP